MRDIDRIIEAVRGYPSIPPVHKQVLISRIEVQPTQAELDAANAIVYPKAPTVREQVEAVVADLFNHDLLEGLDFLGVGEMVSAALDRAGLLRAEPAE